MSKECETMLPVCQAKLDAIHDDVLQTRKAVIGNGYPKGSLIDRMARAETYLVVIGVAAVVLPSIVFGLLSLLT